MRFVSGFFICNIIRYFYNMSLTNSELKALSFGYLTGDDLMAWSAAQLLIKQYEVNPDSLQNGCNKAYSYAIGKLSTRYNLTDELNIIGFILATAQANLTTGVITSIDVLSPGAGYYATPTIAIAGPGTGATATAIVASNSLSQINVTNGGTGYTSLPGITVVGGAPKQRCTLLVDIIALVAVQRILGNLQNVSAEMGKNFTWANDSLNEIRNGQLNLLLPSAASANASVAELVDQSFLTLG